MKQRLIIFAASLLIGMHSYAQNGVAINTTGDDAHISAILDVNSNNKGFLPPRMNTAEMDAITSPSEGLTIYNTTLKTLCTYNGSVWVSLREGHSCGDVTYAGQTYTTVIIGTQCWMQQNLNVGSRIAGSSQQSNNSIIEKFCYNNEDAKCNTYGGLYQWSEAVQYLNGATNETSWSPVPSGNVQGICPAGWHIPSNAEWTKLSDALGGASGAGGKMKEMGTATWTTPNTGASNSSGFTALPAGNSMAGGGFENLGTIAYYWSSSSHAPTLASDMAIANTSGDLNFSGNYKNLGFSVRCLKDN